MNRVVTPDDPMDGNDIVLRRASGTWSGVLVRLCVCVCVWMCVPAFACMCAMSAGVSEGSVNGFKSSVDPLLGCIREEQSGRC